MDRYGKYFINNFLWISDHYCQYYIQDPYWCPEEILDVQFVSFIMWQDAEQWLLQCVEHDPHTTMERLRSFLTFNTSCQVHRFDDRRVVQEVAKEMALWMHKIVIEPKMGQALILDAFTGEPSVPIETEPAPDVSNLLTDLRLQLNAIVAGQKKKYNELEAKLAKMSDEEVAAAYGKRVGKGLILNAWDGLVDLVKSVPDIFDSTLKTVWGLYKTQARLAAAAVQSIRTGSSDPLNREFQTAIQPLVNTYDQAKEVVSMLQVLLGDDEVYDMLYDFAGNYYNATHPLEKTEMASGAFSETAIAIILGLFTGGLGAGAVILTKTGRLKKVAVLLKKIYDVIKRTPSRVKLPKKETIKNVVSNAKNKISRNKGKRGVPEVKTPEKLDNKGKKDYSNNDKEGDPKKKENGSKAKLTKAQIDETVDKIGKSIKNHPLRKEYEDAVAGLKDMEIELKRKGLGEEAIAKQLHQARRDLGVRYKNLTPKELKEYIYEVNEGRCGDKLGPTFDYLRNVKKKSYAEIIESAQRPNPDVDKLLGGFKKWLLTKNGL